MALENEVRVSSEEEVGLEAVVTATKLEPAVVATVKELECLLPMEQ